VYFAQQPTEEDHPMTSANKIIAKPGFLSITYQETPGYLYFDWENFEISLGDCMDAFARAEKAMVEQGVFFIVSDIVKVKQSLRPEVAQWWGEECLPSLAKCGVRLIVNVVPASAPTKSGNSDVVNTIVMQSAHSVSQAESLIRAFQNGKVS
jgi:hypothetical protein